MYVYLSNDHGHVVLPTAVALQPSAEDEATVSFVDALGTVVATFRRRDVFMYSQVEFAVPSEERRERF